MEDILKVDIGKKFRSLGEEVIEVLTEANDSLSEASPSSMHNLLRIFYDFVNKALNIQGLTPSRNMENEFNRLDTRILEAKSTVQRSETQLKETKDGKTRKLLQNKVKSTQEELEYLEFVKNKLGEDSSKEKILKFVDDMLFQVYGGDEITLKGFQTLSKKMGSLISGITGSRSNLLVVETEVKDVPIMKENFLNKSKRKIYTFFRSFFRKEKPKITGLPEEAGGFPLPPPKKESAFKKAIGNVTNTFRKRPKKMHALPKGAEDMAPEEPLSIESPKPEKVPLKVVEAQAKKVLKKKATKSPKKPAKKPVKEDIGVEEDRLADLEKELQNLREKKEHIIESEKDKEKILKVLDSEISYLVKENKGKIRSIMEKEERIKDLDEKVEARSADEVQVDEALIQVVHDFVAEKRKEGFSDDRIQEALLAKNWPKEYIQKSLEI